jgi:hypothetical protein
MVKKAASLAVTAIAFLMPVLALQAGTTSSVTALPAPPPSSQQDINLQAKPVYVVAVPEPGTMALIACALALSFLRGRRRSRVRQSHDWN